MAENKDEQLTDEELAQLQLAEENENAVDRLVKELGCPTRRIRQFAARVLHLLAERDPQRVVPCVPRRGSFKKNGPGDVFRESKLYYFCRRKNKGTV